MHAHVSSAMSVESYVSTQATAAGSHPAGLQHLQDRLPRLG
jgi:hypothetical protein